MGLEWTFDYWWMLPVCAAMTWVFVKLFPLQAWHSLVFRASLMKETSEAAQRAHNAYLLLQQDFFSRASYTDRGFLFEEQQEALDLLYAAYINAQQEHYFYHRYSWRVFLHLETIQEDV